jgi:formate dehydrogenase
VRNYIPAYKDVVEGGWSIGEIAAKSHDLEDKTFGIVGMRRIGQKTAMRLKGFDLNMLYYNLEPIGSINEYVSASAGRISVSSFRGATSLPSTLP